MTAKGIDKENRKVIHEFLDKNIISFEAIVKNRELIELLAWADRALHNGSALHIIVEDGNLEDDCLDHCEERIKSGKWEVECKDYNWAHSEEEDIKMLRIVELLRPLTEEEREMIYTRGVITEDLFNLLYNTVTETVMESEREKVEKESESRIVLLN